MQLWYMLICRAANCTLDLPATAWIQDDETSGTAKAGSSAMLLWHMTISVTGVSSFLLIYLSKSPQISLMSSLMQADRPTNQPTKAMQLVNRKNIAAAHSFKSGCLCPALISLSRSSCHKLHAEGQVTASLKNKRGWTAET